jgi:oligopeptidase A
MTNPLLENLTLPAFSRIRPEHIEPAIDQLLEEHRVLLRSVLDKPEEHTWETLFQPLEDKDDQLDRAWSPVSHLHSVADNDDLRRAYNACLPKLTDHATELGQNEDLFHACKALAEGEGYSRLGISRQKIISNALRDFRLSGIDLEQQEKDRYKELQQRLSKLQTRYEENLLDATHGWTRPVTDKALLGGLPDTALELAAETARRRDQAGWLFTLEYPSYQPVMTYADDRQFRQEMYTAYNTRASELGPNAGRWDNGPLMTEILSLRQELAALLGYRNYAEYSLVKKMADVPDDVMAFLHDLAARSKAVAQQELADLEKFAAEEYGLQDLQAWDIPYYSEKLKQKRFDFSQEDLRPYFPADQVVEGLFSVVNRLYGLSISSREGIETWHPDARFYEIRDDSGRLRGGFYLDLYARPHKRGGAWMDECVIRRLNSGAVQSPVAYLTCNFTPPVSGKPSLLTHDEALTLFHEFGHGMHHILTLIDYAGVSGINGVPWDAVELPSQFLENWCWERESLGLFARHHQTGEPLPPDLFEKMQQAKTFHAGMRMVRQLELALFDFRLHKERRGHDTDDIQALLDEVRQDVAVVRAPPDNRFQHGFAHIFAGGYAAGYYSYKWAEVLSADAFSRFEENGIFDSATGRSFLHTILEQGGSREPMDLFVEFRGRKPEIDALLRHSGITPDRGQI